MPYWCCHPLKVKLGTEVDVATFPNKARQGVNEFMARTLAEIPFLLMPSIFLISESAVAEATFINFRCPLGREMITAGFSRMHAYIFDLHTVLV